MTRINKYIVILLLMVLFLPSTVISDWKKVENLPPPYDRGSYLEVMFLKNNTKLGWICGFGGAVLRTTDAGETWTGTTISGADQLESISFVDSLHGYTSGMGQLYKSVDGGVTWYSIITNDLIEGAIWGNYFTSPDTGIVVGGGCGSRQNFFRTVDGGMSWSLSQTSIPNAGMTDVVILDSKGLGFATGSGMIFRTTNGGVSWSSYTRSGNSAWQEELAIYKNTFLVPYSGGCLGGNGDGGVRMSINNGMNWRSKAFSETPFFGAFLMDTLRGWACGWNEHIIYTYDGGKTWDLNNCGIPDGVNLDDIYFVNDTTGWVVGEGVFRYYTYVKAKPDITIQSETSICEGDSVILTVVGDYTYYTWSNGARTKSIKVDKSGDYWVACNNVRCDSALSDKITITVNKAPQPKIVVSNDKPCEGDTVILSMFSKYPSHIWFDGKTDDSVKVTETGTYSLEVVDENGCKGTAKIFVKFNPLPKPQIIALGKKTFCDGDSTTLETQSGMNSYEWLNKEDATYHSTGSNRVIVKTPGHYYVIVKSGYCTGISDTMQIQVMLDSNKLEISSEPAYSGYFDSVVVKDIYCKKIKIVNTSIYSVNIKDIFMMHNVMFSIPQTQFDLTLLPKESITLDVCFAPTAQGLQRDTIVLTDVCFDHYVPLSGIGEVVRDDYSTSCGVIIRVGITKANKTYFSIQPPKPNPASDKINISYIAPDNQSNLSIEIFNSIGNPIKADVVNNITGLNHDVTIDTKDMESGMYIIKVSADEAFQVFKVIVTK